MDTFAILRKFSFNVYRNLCHIKAIHFITRLNVLFLNTDGLKLINFSMCLR